MGQQKGKRQVVVYLRPEVCDDLRLHAARTGETMSGIVEEALRTTLASHGKRLLLRGDLETTAPAVVEALAHFGAPLWSHGQPTAMTLEETIATALALAPQHPSLLHVLPVVLHKNRGQIRWPELRSRVPDAELPALGMLLDLTADVTGGGPFGGWADELRRAGARHRPPEPFFVAQARSARYRELAELRTPEVVRRWGFLMATPIEDFRAAMRRHCLDSPSSIAPT